jgi:uncharacterized protein involved in exopolysaccharide biosynthesis
MDGSVEEAAAIESTAEPELFPPGEPTIFGAIWRYKAVAIGCTIAILAVAALYGLSRPHQYVATATLIVRAPSGADTGDLGRYVTDQVAILQSPELTSKALSIAGRHLPPGSVSYDDFVASTDIVTTATSDVIMIGFSAKTPELAQAGANSLGIAYVGTQFIGSPPQAIFLPAKTPTAPTSTAMLRLLAVALVLGLLASAALCYILALRNWRAPRGGHARQRDS